MTELFLLLPACCCMLLPAQNPISFTILSVLCVCMPLLHILFVFKIVVLCATQPLMCTWVRGITIEELTSGAIMFVNYGTAGTAALKWLRQWWFRGKQSVKCAWHPSRVASSLKTSHTHTHTYTWGFCYVHIVEKIKTPIECNVTVGK